MIHVRARTGKRDFGSMHNDVAAKASKGSVESTMVSGGGVCSKAEVGRLIPSSLDGLAHQVLAVGTREGEVCLMQQLQQWHPLRPVVHRKLPVIFLCSGVCYTSGRRSS